MPVRRLPLAQWIGAAVLPESKDSESIRHFSHVEWHKTGYYITR